MCPHPASAASCCLSEPHRRHEPPRSTNTTIELLEKIKARGMTEIIIEHDVRCRSSSPADRISVLAGGRVIVEGLPDEVRGDRRGAGSLSRGSPLVAVALNTAVAAAPRQQGPRPTCPCAISRVPIHGESDPVPGSSYSIEEGEILALLGRNGAGKIPPPCGAIARLDNPSLQQGEMLAGRQAAAQDEVARGGRGRRAARAGGSPHHCRPHRRGKPAARPRCPRSRPGRSSASTSSSHASPNAAGRKASRCRASSRCSLSPAHSPAT